LFGPSTEGVGERFPVHLRSALPPPERCRLSPVPPPPEHQTRGQPIEPVLQFALLSDEPRFRRRPPSSTRAGDAIQTNIALIGIRPRRPLRRALDINYRSRRCSEEKNYFFFFFAFLAFFAFFAFFAMLPSKQLSGWRYRCDAHLK
jgi:hypothetical protein